MEGTPFYSWLNFLVFVFALGYFLREPVRDFLGDRRENFRRELDVLRRKRQEMESLLLDYRKKLEGVSREIQKLIEELRKEGEFEKTVIVQKARQYSQKIREDAERMGRQEFTKAKGALRKKTLLLALSLAKKELEKTLEAEDQERIALWAVAQFKGFKDEGAHSR